MGVIRVERNKNFTHMANYHLKDKDLSLRAIGLMSKMLSLPEDWDYTVAGLASICKEGREAVRKVLQELEGAGYLVRQQERAGGKFAGADYVLFERPGAHSPLPGNLDGGAPPVPGKPGTGNPVPDIPPELNTNNQETKNNPPKAPQGAAWEPELFDRFWKLYPRKKDRAKAIRAWDKLKADRKLMQTMSAALKVQMASEEWQRDKGRAIPYPSTWLNNRRWEDEPDGSTELNVDAHRGAAGTVPSERRDVLWI